MTKNQIQKALQRSGIELAGISINSSRELSVMIMDSDGDVDFKNTNHMAAAVGTAVGWGGFECASGEWILQDGYRVGSEINQR